MKASVFPLISILLVALPQVIHAQIIDREIIAQCVVQLVNPRTEKIQVDGREAEIWYKFASDGSVQPAIQYDSGSAFLIEASNNLFLVTASHVAKSMTADSFAVIMGTNGASDRIPLTLLAGSTSSTSWIHHAEADVAVLHLHPSSDISATHLQQRFLPVELVVRELQAPSRSIPLTVFGFPLGMGTSQQFAPLTKQTYCASDIVRLKRADIPVLTDFFLLEDPSVEGYSGGPVLDISVYKLGAMQTTGGGTKLYGLIHGTQSDSTGGKLALVVPAHFIIETLSKALTAATTTTGQQRFGPYR